VKPLPKAIFVHPTSSVSEKAILGAGTKIWQFCTILGGARLGSDCLLSQNVYVEGRAVIGDRVKIKNNVSVYDCVTIEDDVFVGPSAVFTNVINPRSFVSRKEEFLPTLVRRGATLGANSTIVCGVTIGEYAFVGAGAVVTRDVPPYAIVLGVPARRRGWVCRCGVTLPKRSRAVCPSCGSVYRITPASCKLGA
jgi:UDP-2-acetamido-3-amino-2,3-dideoxy-glucuronate N-acetyltransferase